MKINDPMSSQKCMKMKKIELLFHLSCCNQA